MEKNFGKELEIKHEFVVKLEDFKDIILYLLEDYLYQTKLAPSFRQYFNIPQIFFDEGGCCYTDRADYAYVSPEFFAKCFLERTMQVLNFFSELYYPTYMMSEKNKDLKNNFRDEEEKTRFEEVVEKIFGKIPKFLHMDFIQTYNFFVNLRKINLATSHGLMGAVQSPNDVNSIIFLRKLEFASKFQKDLEFVLDRIGTQEIQRELWDFDDEAFYNSPEYKRLSREHQKLFRSGPFEEAMETPEWETFKSYDYGTDEEREKFKEKYKAIKNEFEQKRRLKIKESISDRNFSVIKIQNELIDYWKSKIYNYVYPVKNDYSDVYLNVGVCSDVKVNELGLDVISYYAHPADKYMPQRILKKKYKNHEDEQWDEDVKDAYAHLYGGKPYCDYDE